MEIKSVGECTPEEKRRALDHALHSRTFARADQLRSFLRYICEAEMAGETERLTESAIGIEVLRRPKGYTPVEDSSVRTRAYELRHRLEKLYTLESPGREIRINVPKGSYIPSYERHLVLEPAVIAEGLPPPPTEAEPHSGRREIRPGLLILLTAAAFLAGIGAAIVGLRMPGIDPVIRQAWGPFAHRDANILLCIATPLHLTVGPAEHEIKGKPYYPAPKEAYPLFTQSRPLEDGARLGLLFTNHVVGFGTINAVLSISSRLRAMGATFQTFPERVAPVSTFRDRNVMLFGAPVDSDAITETLASVPLTVEVDPVVKEFVIRDRKTHRAWTPMRDAQGEFTVVYGLVTVLNTRRSEAGGLGEVAFSGITSAGTQGAAEFFSNPRSLRDLRDQFAKAGIRGFPLAYQVVVKCRFANRLLLSFECVDQRIIPRS